MTAPIVVENVGKRYTQLEERAMLLKSVIPFMRPKRTDLWALRNFNLTVNEGETVGIVGRNGAGKTTLLRLLAGVTRPSEGTATIRGRVAPLIGVGVGFHQEMSGRENIFVNGMVLGLTKREVQARFDQIVDFAELHSFIDTPVKFYSTGMFMRLGFSVAANVNPDVLLVDEILAVGDFAFQAKCIERMKELQRQGTTIVMVSHSMHAIRFLCPRALLLRKGQLEFDGATEDTLAMHHRLMTEDHAEDSGGVTITVEDRDLYGPEGPTHQPRTGDQVTYRATLSFAQFVESPIVFFQVFSEEGTIAYSLVSAMGRDGISFGPGDTTTVEIPFTVRLVSGTFRLAMTVMDQHGREELAHDSPGLLIYVRGVFGAQGIADLGASVSIGGVDVTEHPSLLIGASADELDAETPGPL